MTKENGMGSLLGVFIGTFVGLAMGYSLFLSKDNQIPKQDKIQSITKEQYHNPTGMSIKYLGKDKEERYVLLTDKEEPRLILPSKLEITVEEQDLCTEQETIIDNFGKKYFFQHDGKRLRLVPYELKPAVIVPKE